MPTVSLTADAITAASGSATLSATQVVSLGADGLTAGSGALDFSLLQTVPLVGSGRTAADASLDLTGASDAATLSVTDAIREILLLWGIEDLGNTPDFARRRALNDLNAAMQTVWNQAKQRDYWTRATIAATIAAEGRSVTLDDDIQNVIGPARLENRQPLVPLTSRGEIDHFEMAFLGEDSREREEGTPMAYFIERLNQSGTEPAKCVLHVAPAPSAETIVTLDVVKEAPRYVTGDICSGTLLPIPHKYVETLLLPVARYKAMSCHLFIAESQRQEIENGLVLAMAQIEGADPTPAKKIETTERSEAR